jgi:hypothetical protein
MLPDCFYIPPKGKAREPRKNDNVTMTLWLWGAEDPSHQGLLVYRLINSKIPFHTVEICCLQNHT